VPDTVEEARPIAAYKMPRSRLWGRVRDSVLKPALKRLLGRGFYHDLTEKYYWANVFVNYVFMRVPFLRRAFKVGLWSQSLYIEGTNACNAACVFCAYPQMERAKAVMPMTLFKKSIDEWAALGGDEIDLTPIVGEPLADKFLFERMDYMMSVPKIRRFHFFTNAVLIFILVCIVIFTIVRFTTNAVKHQQNGCLTRKNPTTASILCHTPPPQVQRIRIFWRIPKKNWPSCSRNNFFVRAFFI
jgi:hypothetical protein